MYKIDLNKNKELLKLHRKLTKKKYIIEIYTNYKLYPIKNIYLPDMPPSKCEQLN